MRLVDSMHSYETHPEVMPVSKDYHCRKNPSRYSVTPCKEPSFQIHQKACSRIFGTNPSVTLGLVEDRPLFHEAAVYLPKTEELFVTSSQVEGPNIVISKLTRDGRDDGTWRCEEVSTDEIPMANGAVNYPASQSILFCAQGTQCKPGGLFLMAAEPPYAAQPLLTSYHGRWFNSPNDVIVARDGAIWFTDPIYGFTQGFRPSPQLPNQVYRFDPATGALRVMADGFGRPNGLCFDPEESTLYVTDTDYFRGDGNTADTRHSHIYAFSVEQRHGAPFLTNRTLFAMADVGAPDGIKCDLQGNVYSGCGDGISIWAPTGVLLGKILIPDGVANFCFGRPGELFVLNETQFWIVHVAQSVQGALLSALGIEVQDVKERSQKGHGIDHHSIPYR